MGRRADSVGLGREHHRQRVSRARPELLRLIREPELRPDEPPDGLEIHHVRRRGLDVPVLGRNEERRDDEERREHRGHLRAPAARAHDPTRNPQEPDGNAERRKLRDEVVPDVGEELVDDAVHQVRCEQRDVDVEVGVVLVVEVALASDRERHANDEEPAEHTGPHAPPTRSRIEQRAPHDDALHDRGQVGCAVEAVELGEARATTRDVDHEHHRERREQQRHHDPGPHPREPSQRRPRGRTHSGSG